MSKQDKSPAFLICSNPMADETHGDRLFITHTRHPVMIAQVIDGEFKPIYIDPTFCIEHDETVYKEKIAGVMKRMADWFNAYLKWMEPSDEWKKEHVTVKEVQIGETQIYKYTGDTNTTKKNTDDKS
jgi:hypothetical protein